jgi:hypothetical protein
LRCWEVPLSITIPPWPEAEVAAFDILSPELRATRFRELASQARSSAALVEGKQREVLMESAGIWERLANLAEEDQG